VFEVKKEKMMLLLHNVSNYHIDGSPEAPHFTWELI
jgi:hypothetical protein